MTTPPEDIEIPVPAHPCPGPCTCENTGAYLRVSAVMGRDELISPELQMHEITTWAARNHKRIVKVIADIDKSGRSFTKRRVGEAIDDIQHGDYKSIALWKWSRWGRNLKDSLIHLARVEEAGGRVHAATEDFDPKTAMGRFTRDLILRMAELQSEQISDGWKETQAKRRRDGLPHTAAPRFGYTYTRDAGYQIDPVTGPLLTSAYELVVAGKPFRELVAEWNAKGIKTVTGLPWRPGGLTKMLNTGFGAGLIRERSQPPASGAGGAGPIHAYDTWRKGAQPPVINTEMWEAYKAKSEAQALLAPRLRVAAHALSGLLYCSECETRMVSAFSGRHKKHQWVCSRARDVKDHRFTSISNAPAMEQVLVWVKGEIGREQDVTLEAERLARASQAGADAIDYTAELSRLTARRKRINDRLTDADDLDRVDLEEQLAEVKASFRVAEAGLAAAKLVGKQGEHNLVRAFTTLRDEWASFTPHDHREALSKLIEKILVTPGAVKGTRASIDVIPTYKD